MKKIKFFKFITVFTMILIMCSPVYSLAAQAGNSTILPEIPSKAEIIAKYDELSYDLTRSENATDYSITSPYAKGSMDQESLDNALNALNFVRYVAGVPSDVVLYDDYNSKTQAASLVNAVNGALSHTPAQPDGMDDELYLEGYAGASQSNIASGYKNIASSIVEGYMWDNTAGNIPMLGHRRWVINPSMQKVGFGKVDRYSAMYSFDRSRANTPNYSYVSWPAENMPIELMMSDYWRKYPTDYPWSVSLGNCYKAPDISAVTVTLTDVLTGQVWEFSQETSDYEANYFNVNNQSYGVAKCIIFRPNPDEIVIEKGKQFVVNIAGLQTSAGEETSLSYEVNIFSLSDTITDETNPDDSDQNDTITDVFADVEDDTWYFDAVQYVYDAGIMSGSNGLFNPTKNVTRAQVVSTLYRLAGSPEVSDYSACEELLDVQKNAWYTDAVCWAYNTGVGTGNLNTMMFNMNNSVTRQQLATFFYNYAQYKEIDTTATSDLSGLLNTDKVSSYAETAVKWAVGAGIISGSKTTDASGNIAYDLNPTGTATRAQIAAILQRFCETYDVL